ncbi:unnamed protein product [Tuber melanosporum]|uniref:(Perigord truffle) hypothetical protein n=1 Tax=Tuber melanosporum (strain Mel28) TaxID=656061 RepID=D5GNW4_TUBMM|nr:uncharacterized protein GSTUM_00011543001 [Tuber melanosporum]CAZ86207.1 unnamed protein product [Tuber melanosporum]
MTDAESFYDKLLASLAIPGLELGPRNESERSNSGAEAPATEALEGRGQMNGLGSGSGLVGFQDSNRRLVASKSPIETRDCGLGEEVESVTTRVEQRRDEALQDAPSPREPDKPHPPANLPSPEQPKSGSTGALKIRTSAALEAELRRRLLESGLRKRKSVSEPENAPASPENCAPEPDPPGPDKAAELRRRLLFERNTYEKQKSSAQKPRSTPLKTPTGPMRSQSPISISSDDDDQHTTKSLSHPVSLPPRPPPRIGFRLRILVPFAASASGYLVMQTEELPLSTTLASIIELFGPLNDRDHLYFPHSRPKPSQSVMKAEGGDEERQEEDLGQRFYYEPEDSEIEPQGDAAGQSVGTPTKKPSETRPKSAKSSLNGGVPEFVPVDKKERPDEPGSWVVGRKTLEDVWTEGKQVVECILIRAGELDRHEQGQAAEMYEDVGYLQQNGWGGTREFLPAGKQSDGESHGQWGFGASGFPPDNMNYGYPNQQWGGPYLDPNMPSPSTPWFPQQNFTQQSPVFLSPQQPQPDFSPEGSNGQQAMHWIPGHTDYTTAGWMYGFNGTADTSVPQESPTVGEGTPIPPAPESRGAPGSAKKRMRGGRRKKDRGKPGPISSPGVARAGGPSRPGH